MGHPICRRVHTCFLVILLVPLAVSTAKADINNTVFSQPDSGMYGFTSLNQKCRPFNVNSEAAEFDVRGQVERIVVDGRIYGEITQNKHITVKFLAVFRPSTGTWYRMNSNDGVRTADPLDLSDDRPAAGDFDGDGRWDMSVFRTSDGTWYTLKGRLVRMAGQPTRAAFRIKG